MVMGNCMPGDGGDGLSQAIVTGLQAVAHALSGRDSSAAEPRGLISIRREVTTYDFDIEGVVKALFVSKRRSSQHDEDGEDGEGAHEQLARSDAVIKAAREQIAQSDAIRKAARERLARETVAAQSSLETPDGKLKPEVAESLVAGLLGDRRDHHSINRALEVLNIVSDQHRGQLLEELAKLAEIGRFANTSDGPPQQDAPVV